MAYVAIAVLHSLTPFTFTMTSGLSVHSAAMPTIALMTSLASICGTTLNTMTVARRPKATTMTGVSSALPARRLMFGVGFSAEMLRRSDWCWRKAVSCSTIGAFLVIQLR